MKFLADMGISPKTVAFLASLGHDAVHLHDQGLERMPDPDILEKARSESRILLTHDLDIIQHHESLEQGAIISLTEGQIRVRPLPIRSSE